MFQKITQIVKKKLLQKLLELLNDLPFLQERMKTELVIS